MLKVLLVSSPRFYKLTRAEGLRRIGCEVEFLDSDPALTWGGRPGAWIRLRLDSGPGIWNLNREVIRRCTAFQPDLLWIDKGVLIEPRTVDRVHELCGATVVHINPDDPFGPGGRSEGGRKLWRRFLQAVPGYDLHLCHRWVEMKDLREAGASNVFKTLFTFYPSVHRPVELAAKRWEEFQCDVVFVGRHEPHREVILRSLIKAGVRVRIWGEGLEWAKLADDPGLRPSIMGRGVWGEEYAFAVSGAKLVLNPLTRLNRDEHAMRSFEAPAFNRAMVTDLTPEHQRLFGEDQAAGFYSEAEECVEKTRALLRDEGSRQTLAGQGLTRVRTGEHSAMHRAAQQLAAALLVRRGQKVFGELSPERIRDALAAQGLAYPGPEVAYPEYWQ